MIEREERGESREMRAARVAVGRRFGPSPGAIERMRAHDAEAIWTGRCRLCKAQLKGTPKQLREHICGGAGG